MKCPCHSGKEYTECCAPYHQGEAPPTPLALMRSRYSAYALGNSAYIMETTHSTHPDHQRPRAQWKALIEAFSQQSSFTGLEILEAEDAYVTFKAVLGDQGEFTEKSEFAQEKEKWRYKRAVFIS